MSNIKVPTCYASCSIGYKPEHNVPAKLKAISAAGFEAIELSMPDLVSFAQEHLGKDVTEKDYANLCVAGQEVKRLCAANGLKILVLQPFANFEGWPQRSSERKDAFNRAKGWLEVMHAVGTDMLQVCTASIHGVGLGVASAEASFGFRSALLTHPTFRLLKNILPTTLPNSLICSLRTTFVFRMRIGAGRHTLPHGGRYGKSFRKPIRKILDYAWTRSRRPEGNGQTPQLNQE